MNIDKYGSYKILKCRKIKCGKVFTSRETKNVKKIMPWYSSLRIGCPYCKGGVSILRIVYYSSPIKKKCDLCGDFFLTHNGFIKRCMTCKSYNKTSQNEFWTYPGYWEKRKDLEILNNLKK